MQLAHIILRALLTPAITLTLLTASLANAESAAEYDCQSLRYSSNYGLKMTMNLDEEDRLMAAIQYHVSFGSEKRWETKVQFDESVHAFVGKLFNLAPDTLTKSGGFAGLLKASHGLSRFVGTVVCHPISAEDMQ